MCARQFFGFLVVAMLVYRPAAEGASPIQPTFNEKAVANFYHGKTLRIIVGFTPGGGYDQYSRLIGRHLSKYIPGNPAIIVDNMAGAASIIAANYTFNAAPKDGTIIGNISGPIILEQLFNNPAVQFDMAKFRYLAVPVSESYIMVVTRKPGVTKFDELIGPKGKQVTFGGIGGSTVEHAPVLARDILGANIKLVLGYKGTADVRLAIDSGEVEGFFNSWTSLKVTSFDKVKNGEPVLVYWKGQEYDYVITGREIVNPDHVQILNNTAEPRLTIFTCTPVFSTKHRLVLYGKLIS